MLVTQTHQIFAACLAFLACLSSSAHAESYRLAAGDLRAVIVHGVVGKFGQAPVYFPSPEHDFFPASGYPYPVLEDGKLHLPMIDAVEVTGLNVIEAQRAVSAAYTAAKVLSKPNMVALTLLKKRDINALVVHSQTGPNRSRVEAVKLSADQATVLGAIAEAGKFDPQAKVRVLSPGSTTPRAGQRLGEGAIVELVSPRPEYYFTGGLVAGGEHALPTDRTLNAIQAVSAAGGYRQQGFLPPRRLIVVGKASPAYSLPLGRVLNNPSSVIVRPGDTLIVR